MSPSDRITYRSDETFKIKKYLNNNNNNNNNNTLNK